MDRRLCAAAAAALLLAACNNVSASDVERQANEALLLATVKTKMIAADPDSTVSVGIRVTNGVATLRGTVRTEPDREKILAAARSVHGVRTVLDEVAVDPNLPTMRERATDAALTARIEAAIFTQSGATDVRVSTGRGIVTLSGTVPDQRVRRAALATARNTSGVRGVVDRMRG